VDASKLIINRSALQSANGWNHIVPKGELPNSEAGIVQLLDDESLDAILANIERDKNRLGDNWTGLYAGREHFIYDSTQDSAALAWFKDFEKRENGIWANNDGLTPIGADALKNLLYKFTSFVADPADLEKVAGKSEGGWPVYRVLKIETVGFTNLANGKDLLTPITNRGNYGSHGTKEAWESARDKNAKQIEQRKDDTVKANEARRLSQVGEAQELALPALEQWFKAVKNVQDIGVKHGGVQMNFNWCWAKAKEEHPEIYSAAFGVADAPADEKSAADQVGKLSNRISAESGQGHHFSWNFIRENLPRIFNRMLAPAQRVFNRSLETDPTAAGQRASKIFMDLAGAESAIQRFSLSQGMQRVTNRHPGLAALANGKVGLGAAISIEPNLRTLIQD
jgi:hypothetical protein